MQKVLIITYYWPPAGGPGVQRWLKFVKYFRYFDIEPIVYIPENPTYPMTDTTFVKDVPEDITIIKGAIFEPYAFANVFSKNKTKTISSGIISTKKQSVTEKVLLWIRGNLFIPDARKFWVKPSVTYLSEYIKENHIETIVTTGPPHSVHLIGMQLKEKIGVKWLADFRDPWTSIGYHSKLKLTKKSQRKHKELESKVLNNASAISVTSFTTKDEFSKLTNTPIAVITNGYDNEKVKNNKLNNNFTLSHIGSLLSGRNPKVLWSILKELCDTIDSFKNDLEITLAGKVSEEIIDSITKFGLTDNVVLKGYLSHEDALILQRESQVLLLLEINSEETKGIIPGKLFEYIISKRPILAIGPEEWDAARIISNTKTGNTFNYSEEQKIKETILAYYNLYKKNELFVTSTNVEVYSRKNLTQHMASLLKSL
ncbi:glycosyltransferase family protein [Neptunitalea lumnitzerae]|uniref:Glycosyl transferase family 1 n=1 Tax=Neptunitalea lumnitzerae TaxID=2965509 RepID=A0ABQ5MJ76_9FLAO|nr:glycosyl transferase family 1 [Neptunitalea sp. Y10]GLB49470.1 glycosyl transferase family 1 [Neptunitalea sp. Y10]